MAKYEERIDAAKEGANTFETLVQDTVRYVKKEIPNPKDRLHLERKLQKYAASNTPDWLLNLILRVHEAHDRDSDNG